MKRALFVKALGDGKLLLAALSILVFGITWIDIWLSSMIHLPALSTFLLDALPQSWERLSGASFREVATSAGRVALVYVHPLVLLSATVWAIARGSDTVSGEIGRGTMEMILAQPVSRMAVYVTQAFATVLGSAVLAGAAWCGTAAALATVKLPDHVAPALYLPPAVNLFGLMVCLSGMSTFASSWESQRWRTVGLMGAIYAASTILKVIGRMVDGWHWVGYLSFLSAFEPQALVARPAEAWSLFIYQDRAVTGINLGGQQVVLVGVGLICFLAGAIVFNRREIPAPL